MQSRLWVARFALLALFVGALFVALVGCKKGPPDPVTPPAQAGPSATPRFDGVYAAKVESPQSAQSMTPGGGEGSIDLLRFTEDGKVTSLTVSSMSVLETAVKSLVAGTSSGATGTYAVKDGVLRFTLTSKLGSVEYAGAIKDDQLNVRWHSSINDATIEEAFSFVKIDPPSAEEKEKEENSIEPVEDAGAPATPAGPVLPEAKLIPQGKAWFCFRAPVMNTSRCERTSEQCEAAHKEASAARPDLKLTHCQKRPNAFCHTVMRRGPSPRGSGFCYGAEEECKAGAGGFEGADLVVSVCASF